MTTFIKKKAQNILVKAATSILVGLAALNAQSQTANPSTAGTPKTQVTVRLTDKGATAELPFMPIGHSTTVSSARFSAMYFGPQSDSDISFLILAKSPRPRYSGNRSFGVRFLINETPLKTNLRKVNKVVRDSDGESLQFSVTTEDVAWMATADKLSFVVYDADTEDKLDTYDFTVGGLQELKTFAGSVRLVRNYEP
ncbi:MAG: hypothetical protein M3Q26_07225 [Acidobacteriota bacterium]|nr:hypothetical protein [Acidobacteriota bacterium]